MRRSAAVVALFSLASFAAHTYASNVAFVYPNEEAVLSGKPIVATVSNDGIVVPADAVLAAGGEVLVGLTDDLVKKATLIRLDKDLNVAVLKLGDRLLNPDLQKAHRNRIAQLHTLLPSEITLSSATVSGPPTDLGEPLISSGTRICNITFNGKPITQDVIHFKTFLNKQKFSIELLMTNSEPVKNLSFKIHANPKLTFVGLQSSLSRTLMPGSDFQYKYFSLVQAGKTFEFPIEARGISVKDYEWILEVKADGHQQQEKLFVHFD